MRVVVALGGNALLPPGAADASDDAQAARVRAAVDGLVDVASEHDVVVTHGNGPQVGALASQLGVGPSPLPGALDVLGAETEGMLGYLLQLALTNRLPDRDVVTLLTLVEVASPGDARVPTKPIGVVQPGSARADAEARGWRLAPVGDGWRRVVPSPPPLRLIAPDPLRALVDDGAVVVCGGGGGIPVTRTRHGLAGVEAVVDKDLTSALVAEAVGADLLVIATDVDAVYDGWGSDAPVALVQETPSSLRRRQFAEGSMAPKVAAAANFVTRSGGRAAIGALGAIPDLVRGTAGTQVTRG
jgi:carbamate kinase